MGWGWGRWREGKRGRRDRKATPAGVYGEKKALSRYPLTPPCPQGLSASLAAELLLRDGPNALRPPKGTPEYVKFARQLAGGLQCLMWVAAAICLIAFGIQASEGDLTTDDNVSGGCWAGAVWTQGPRGQRTLSMGLRTQET